MAFSDAPRATRVNNFLRVGLCSDNQNLTVFTSNTMRGSCGKVPDSSRLYCKIMNVSILPPLQFSFSTGTDLSNVAGRPLCWFSEVLITAWCTQISRWIVRNVCFAGFEGVWLALCLRPDFFSRTSVSDQLVYVDGVQHPKARTRLRSTHRRCSTHLVSVWCAPRCPLRYFYGRSWCCTIGGNM